MIKKAVILAAGEGRRLKPFTEAIPKVMLPVANRPILDHVLDSVRKNGIEDIIMVVGYKKESIMDYFRDEDDITYVFQDKQLGTAHALLQAREYIDEPFVVLPGDNIIDQTSIRKLMNSKSDISILIKEHQHPSKYGVVFLEEKRIKKIVEKPTDGTNRFISTGIYKFPVSIFSEIEELSSQGVYDLTSVLQTLLNQGEEIEAVIAERWMDIVYPWDIININEIMIRSIASSTAGVIEKNVILKGNVLIGKNTVIYSGSYIQGPAVIGEGCEIGPNVCIFPSTVIGNNITIHPFSEIRNSVIMDETRIGSNASISNSVIGRGNTIDSHFSTISGRSIIEIEGEFNEVEDIGAIIGEDCNIGSHVVIESGKIIGRRCDIDSLKRIIKDIPSERKVM